MPRRARARRVAHLREHALSRLCALWFIVLILLPFTAPFPTYQIHDASSHQPYDALPKDMKGKADSDDKLALPSPSAVALASVNVVLARSMPLIDRAVEYSPRRTVLRI